MFNKKVYSKYQNKVAGTGTEPAQNTTYTVYACMLNLLVLFCAVPKTGYFVLRFTVLQQK